MRPLLGKPISGIGPKRASRSSAKGFGVDDSHFRRQRVTCPVVAGPRVDQTRGSGRARGDDGETKPLGGQGIAQARRRHKSRAVDFLGPLNMVEVAGVQQAVGEHPAVEVFVDDDTMDAGMAARSQRRRVDAGRGWEDATAVGERAGTGHEAGQGRHMLLGDQVRSQTVEQGDENAPVVHRAPSPSVPVISVGSFNSTARIPAAWRRSSRSGVSVPGASPVFRSPAVAHTAWP